MKAKFSIFTACLILGLALFADLRLMAAPFTPQAQTGVDTLVSPVVEPDSLILQNRLIMVFRANEVYSPKQRRQSALERIMTVIKAGKMDSVGARQVPRGMLISIGERGVFVIAPSDIDSLTGETLTAVSRRAVANLTQVLREEIHQRSFSYLLTGIVLIMLATLALALLLWVIRRGHRYLDEGLQRVATAGISRARLDALTQVEASRPLAILRRLFASAAWIAGLLVVYMWLTFSLRRFPYTRPWGDALRVFFLTTFENFGAAIIAAIPNLVTVLLIFIITRFIIRLVKAFFAAVEAGRITVPWLHADTAQPTRRIAVVIIWLFALILAYPYLPGSDTDAFKGVSVFAGLMLTLGSAGVVSQMMSGFVLIYSRAFKPQDYVRIGEVEGTVMSMGILSTKIKTNKLEEITFPNNVITATTVKNYSRLHASEGVILYTTVTIGYSTPWRQVHAMLIMAAERTPGLRQEPPPFVGQTALADFYVEYQINAYMEKPEERVRTLALLHANIQDVFNEYGVQILSPHYEADPPQTVWVPKEKWHEPPAKRPSDGEATA